MRTTTRFAMCRLILVLCLYAFPSYGWQAAHDQDRYRAIALTVERHNQPARREEPEGNSIAGAFAFANRAGTELLVTDQNASNKNAVVKTFTTTVCPGNKVFGVRYVGHQSSGKKDSGRDASRNFTNVAGSVFHIVEGSVKADEHCLLASATYMKDRRPLPMKVAARQDQPVNALRCDAQTQGGLRRQQGRAPVDCWQLAQIDPDGRLLAVLYEPHGKDLLAALVLEVGEKHFVYEMPARADAASAWRAGDSGHFDPATLAPLFVLQNDRTGSWDVGISWAGEEGANLSVYRSASASRLKKVVSGYVYWYPE
jgi:hypothetical protein